MAHAWPDWRTTTATNRGPGGDSPQNNASSDANDHTNGGCGAKCHIILFTYDSNEGIQTPFLCAPEEVLQSRDTLREALHCAYHESAKRVVQAADGAQERIRIEVPSPPDLKNYGGGRIALLPKPEHTWLPGSKYLIPEALDPYTHKPREEWTHAMHNPCSRRDLGEMQLLTTLTIGSMLTGAKYAFYEPTWPGLYIPILPDSLKSMGGTNPDFPWNWVELA